VSPVQMRTLPGLFVGRRTLLSVDDTPRDPSATPYVCGACDDELIRADRSALCDVVVRCRCGEFNQL
jgi:hypothetical protein